MQIVEQTATPSEQPQPEEKQLEEVQRHHYGHMLAWVGYDHNQHRKNPLMKYSCLQYTAIKSLLNLTKSFK